MSLDLERIRAEYDHCFGCGRANPLGLQLDDFRIDGSTVSVDWTPRPDYQGFDGILHGGIVAAALDEAMAWAAMLTHDVFVFTGTLDFRYASQAPLDSRYRIEASVLERRGRRLRIESKLTIEGEARPVASARGLFVVAEGVGG
ncbi:MAG: PaaI family thioesterase [Acidimicrobiia bacterium]|nr:PaaI family thioesterase [Acidimicrobiia bacterium]